MNTPSVDLGSIPKLAADDPVIIAFSARRDLCAKPAAASPPAASPADAEPAATGLKITITIAPVTAK